MRQFKCAPGLGSIPASVTAAWLVATSPILLDSLMVPMTDVPVAAAWTVALYLLFGRTRRTAAAAGLAASVAILIRPNLVPIAAVMCSWFAVQWWRGTQLARRDAIRQGAVFVLCVVPGALITAAINARLYGSAFESGYGTPGAIFGLTDLLTNIRNYVRWFAESQGAIALAGLVATLVPVRQLWPDARDRAMVVVSSLVVFTVWAEYFVYQAFDSWSYLRFLLPTWPSIMTALANVLWLPVWRDRRLVRRAVVLAVLLLGIRGVWQAGRRSSFEAQRVEKKFVSAAKLVRAHTGPNSVVLCFMHSGSIRYYGGRITLRQDILDPAWLDRAVEWMADHGVHPYLLLEEEEVTNFEGRFASKNRLGHLEMSPMFVYFSPAPIYFYDLLQSSLPQPIDAVFERSAPFDPAVPVRPPTITFKNSP